jgi:outer membrane protein assembly factor BamB
MSRAVILMVMTLVAATLAGPETQPAATQPAGGGWPMWGGGPHRNAVVATAPDFPLDFDVASGRHVRWSAALGSYSYGGPVVADGRVFVGTNNAHGYRPHSTGDKGCVLCFDAADGKLLWQATHDKLATGAANDWPKQGVASTPLVVDGRVYYVSNRCELVCADADGFYDGHNDGPLTDEPFHERQDADFIWKLDMIAELGVFPCQLAACSPVACGDLVYVCTGNGVNADGILPAPAAPSFIAVDRHRGLVVWKRNDPERKILNGQWSSPACGVIADRNLAIFGGGDGWCYAFAADTGAPRWRFNLNPPDAVWEPGGYGTKTAIVAMPVIVGDTVYLGAGDDPESGTGPGHLYAIDATRQGSVTSSAARWHVGGEDFGRTISSVAVADGLVYAVDLDGYLSCLDAETGTRHWRHDMEAGVWASPVVIGDRVYLGNTDGDLFVLRHGKELKKLARIELPHPIYTPVVAVGDTLFIMTQRQLFAIRRDGNAPAPAE